MQTPFPTDVVQVPLGHDHEFVEALDLLALDEPFHVRPQVGRERDRTPDLREQRRQSHILGDREPGYPQGNFAVTFQADLNSVQLEATLKQLCPCDVTELRPAIDEPATAGLETAEIAGEERAVFKSVPPPMADPETSVRSVPATP